MWCTTRRANCPAWQREITPESLFKWVVEEAVPARPDAVFIAGNGLRAVGVIDALEQEFGLPVLTANQTLLWRTLHCAGVLNPQITGYGRLFGVVPA
ncbi:aspartate racemase/maleate isomerase family protein [Streptomyces lydicamycinicus]|uniref:Putative maleate isomerase n=1 Tax=Streptomyces lydicamycinicus TaxID=1546107 RepID=A0A0P4RGY0_9ACTN|nr:hypothetical protein [Streptomyces lydicamycinicus]GAO13016.1 putative maleate isomerase [Streptomyces lydicamycinicus]